MVPIWNKPENRKVKWKFVGGRFQRKLLIEIDDDIS